MSTKKRVCVAVASYTIAIATTASAQTQEKFSTSVAQPYRGGVTPYVKLLDMAVNTINPGKPAVRITAGIAAGQAVKYLEVEGANVGMREVFGPGVDCVGTLVGTAGFGSGYAQYRTSGTFDSNYSTGGGGIKPGERRTALVALYFDPKFIGSEMNMVCTLVTIPSQRDGDASNNVAQKRFVL